MTDDEHLRRETIDLVELKV